MTTHASTSEMHSSSSQHLEIPGSPIAEERVTLLDLLIVLAERKRIILRSVAISGMLAVVFSLILPKRYTATATILPPQQNSSMAATLAAQLGNMGNMAALGGGSLGLKNPNDMLIAMMKSRTVEDAMVQRFELMKEYHARLLSDARKDLEKNAKIDGNGKDGLIRISIEDRDPVRAAELTNGYIDEFRKLSEHLAITEAAQRRLFFEQQLQQTKDSLANAEEALKKTEQKTGMIQLDSQARALIESAAQLRAEIAAKEVQIHSLETFATDQNAQLVQAQQELSSLQAQLAKLEGSGKGSEANLIAPGGKVPEMGLEYIRKYRDVKYYDTIFDILARQYEAAKLDEAKEGSLLQVVDPAVPPDRRTSPKRALIVLGCTFLGLLLGVAIALAKAASQRVKADPEIAQKLKVLRTNLLFR